ncbi:GntR family transcriptional regulator [Pseudonocardia sp. MH-G8]|uniref:GntR family transcriptional regulator n=1 Tax=Pseudonocardia sp. MH-G8 TaxID=1854588 RepID=UPI000BA0A1C8|nr:GntR family transcriptional regulator [Pseudonocardia sp. MH-G8]OZM79927.1 GntR family transcriptional regulator [Pseudonocardia sp. MH-G8]
MQLSPSAGHPYRAIADQLIGEIRAGRLKPDEQLQSVRELAKRFGVTVATAQRAVAQLVTDGYVTSVPGLGSFVRELPAAEPDDQGLADQVRELRSEIVALRERIDGAEQEQAAALRAGLDAVHERLAQVEEAQRGAS